MAGIYHHTPFCLSKCHYCDFYSLAWKEKTIPQQELTHALSKEIHFWQSILLEKLKADTLFFGGGTPSLLDPEYVEKILEQVHKLTEESFQESTLEVNPKTADLDKLKSYRSLGVNRISMGVQSLDNGLLDRLGRAHDAQEALQSLEFIFAAGFSKVNVDVMYGLPGQTLRQLQTTLEKLQKFSLKHLSAYQLIIEEQTPFYQWHQQGRLDLPKDDIVEDMEKAITNFASSKDMKKYEVSNYACDGHDSKHNQHYWNYDSFIGLGPGAVSFLKLEELKKDALPMSLQEKWDQVQSSKVYGLRLTNKRDLKAYHKYAGSWEALTTEFISEDMAESEFMMMGLRKKTGILLSDFEKKFSKPFPEHLRQNVEKEVRRGYMILHESGFALTPKGQQFANEVIAGFLV